MNKKIIFLTLLALSSDALLQALTCPTQEISLAGLKPEETSFYRNDCKMQVDFNSMTLKPLGSGSNVEASQFGSRAPGVNSLAS